MMSLILWSYIFFSSDTISYSFLERRNQYVTLIRPVAPLFFYWPKISRVSSSNRLCQLSNPRHGQNYKKCRNLRNHLIGSNRPKTLCMTTNNDMTLRIIDYLNVKTAVS